MGLIAAHDGAFDEYEAVALAGQAAGRDTAVFLRRSARPSRRAVLHLHDLRGSFAPADLARWYNERGFHFYVTDLDLADAVASPPRRQRRPGFLALDAARAFLRETGGIDAIILSAQGQAAGIAARWCDARRAVQPADALILSDPAFGRASRRRMSIGCPVLVISAAGQRRRGDPRLGEHVTWLRFSDACDGAAGAQERRRLFDEMGRWLGAYMYGQVRDQLL